MRYRVLPYRQGSKSAKALAEALQGRVLKLVGSIYKPKASDLIINWGNTAFNDQAHWGDNYNLLNDGDLIRCASNKLLFFERMKEAAPGVTPDFWTKREDIPDEAFPIVCRTVLAGHSGAGIVISQCRDDLVPAPLYVRYVKKQDEYRIHIGMGGKVYLPDGDYDLSVGPSIISVQKKARRLETPSEEVNWQVRNHQNGFVYVRQNVQPPVRVIERAKEAFQATGLDFGAVDVIWNAQKGEAYVLEINTAPGLEGQTVEDYAEFFRSLA